MRTPIPLPALTLTGLLMTLAVPLPPFGQSLPRRPFLGVTLRSPALIDGEKRQSGLVVTRVHPQSSALASGIEESDVLLAIDDEAIVDLPSFLGGMQRRRTGDRTSVSLVRAQEELRLELELGPFPEERFEAADVSYGSVTESGRRLRSILTTPQGATKSTSAVFLLQGIDCSSIELGFKPEDSFAQLIRRLTAAGFATLRVEKGGVGDSEGPPCRDNDFNSETAGFLAGLRALKRAPGIDPERIYLLGFSMGGVWAPLIAAQEPVRGMAVYGTIVRPLQEYLLENRRRQGLLGGSAPGGLETALELDARMLHHLFFDELSPQEILDRHPDLGETVLLKASNPEERPLRHLYADRTAEFARQIQQANVSAAWEATEAHVLAVWGRGDYVSARADHELLVDIVHRNRADRARLELVDADHWLVRASSYEQAFEQRHGDGERILPGINESVLDVFVDWFVEIEKTG